MELRKKFMTGLLLAGLLLTLGPCLASAHAKAKGQTSSEQTKQFQLEQKLPIDPKITLGKLKNGFLYYIRENKRPENRAELRLVVNAGSVLEDQDQLGLAHFVEHMSFNGTRHFAKQKLIEFMESIGMRFGPSVNAYTSFDETVYMLTIPTESPDIMKTSFQILEDWAYGLSFEHGEIDKERGVIIEEWRLGQGAMTRMRDKQIPILFKGSRYAERLPIGKKEIIENFKYKTLKRFYRDWYRPELMAVVAVGDFDKSAVESLIKEHFSAIPKLSRPRTRTICAVPDHEETLFAIATDKEATSSSVAVYYKLPLRDQNTVAAYRQQLVEQLYNGLFNRRFSELAQKPNPPFLSAFSSRGRFVRAKEVYMLSARVEDEGIKKGLEALYTESERVARFGFLKSELERQKVDFLRSVERMYAEKEKRESLLYTMDYIQNFLEGEPIPGIEYEFELAKHFLPEITLEEINKLGKEWLTAHNRVIMVNAPEKEGLLVPSEQDLTSVLESIAEKEIKPYEDTVSEQPLLADVLEPGEIVETKSIDKVGVTEWKLSNGAKVVLKPTDFKQDEIVFRAVSPGGTSLSSDEDFMAAQTAAQVIAAGGLNGFNAIDLQKKLSGKVAAVTPYIFELEEGLSGSASPKDLETLFQLIYLRLTAPRADATMFNNLKKQMKAILANRSASPEMAFFDTFQITITQNHLRARPMTVERLEQMDLDKSYAFYKDRFTDASDFTFFFVGNINLEVMKDLVKRYIGSLPSLNRKESWRDVGINPPKGVVQKKVEKGVEPKSMTIIAFTGPFQYDMPHRTEMRTMIDVLETRLRKAIREDLGGTYSIQVSPSYSKMPDEEYTIIINFGADPARVEELTKVVFQEIEKLKTEGPTADEVKDAKEKEWRDFETNSKQNSWWVIQLAYRYSYGENPSELASFKDLLELLTAQAIKKAVQTYFNTENYVQVTLYPEKKKEICFPLALFFSP